jgi:hypothetical protein
MPILCQKHHSKMGLKTTLKGLNVNSPRWNLGFHRRYKNGMRNSNQKKLPVNTLGSPFVLCAVIGKNDAHQSNAIVIIEYSLNRLVQYRGLKTWCNTHWGSQQTVNVPHVKSPYDHIKLQHPLINAC